MTDKLLVSTRDGIKRISFNRPERRNSVDREMVGLLRDEIIRSADDDTRVIVLSGEGDSFCAGADLVATNAQDIANFHFMGERRVRSFDADIHMTTDEMQITIANQRAGQQTGFAKNLKAIADTEYQLTFRGKLLQGIHYW